MKYIILIIVTLAALTANAQMKAYYDTDSTVIIKSFDGIVQKLKIRDRPKVDTINCNHIFVKICKEAQNSGITKYISMEAQVFDDWKTYNVLIQEDCICILCHKKTKCY